ncbi:MAG: hypothetical protein HYS13_20865 [Planctomycetia bacterium]|nr:hypothetical protein [Planctomycetia bacterium]
MDEAAGTLSAAQADIFQPRSAFSADGREIHFLSREKGGEWPTAIRQWRPKLP